MGHTLRKKTINGTFITDFFPFMSNKINLVLVAHVSSTKNVKTVSQSQRRRSDNIYTKHEDEKK